MKHSALLLVLLAGGVLNVLAGDVQVYLIDSPQLKFLQTPKDGLRLTPGGVSGTVSSLLALLPPLRTSPKQLQEVESILKPDVFHRPAAVAAIHIVGITPGKVASQGLETIANGAPVTEASFTPVVPTAPGSQLVAAVAEGAASPDLAHWALDTASLVGCDDACTEDALKAAVAEVGGSYSPGRAPMQGSLAPSQGAEPLNLTSIPERLFATELAALYRSAVQVAADGSRAAEEGPHFLEAMLVGLQGVRSLYGRDSPTFLASWQLLSRVLSKAHERLAEAYNGRLVLHVGVIGEAPNQARRAIKPLLQWGEAHRRRSLLSAPAAVLGSAEEDAQDFSNTAAAVISFLVILLFLVGSFRVIGGMQFKHDSLLYGRTKAD